MVLFMLVLLNTFYSSCVLINDLDVHLVVLKQVGVAQQPICRLDEHWDELLCLFEDFAALERREVWFLVRLEEERLDNLMLSFHYI